MSTIVEINSCNYGSTGKIMLQIAEKAREIGHSVYTCVPSSRTNKAKNVPYQIYIGTIFSRNIHIIFGKITGFSGCFSLISTMIFLKKINTISPDIIHLHNLHNCYINIPLLFSYIKKHQIAVIWTLHDCWPMTGQCPYFSYVGCNKWKKGCYDCQQLNSYPSSLVDRTNYMWRLKKKWFSGVKNLTLVTPSKWLADLTRDSFLSEYPVVVINNGIDLDVFKPTPSNFREKYGFAGHK